MLDDILACEALTAPEVDSLKASYIEVNWLLEFYRSPGRQVPMARFRRYWSPDYTLDPETIQSLWDWWRFWRREPERSRRVTRLVTANWLTYFEMVEGDRPKPDPSAVFLDLYSFGPETPAQARALSPATLDGWFDTAYDAQQAMAFLDGSHARTVERGNHFDLLILVATELYRRDHGTDPPVPEALVGPYLKSLPPEFRDDGKVDEPPVSARRPER